ncbi:MAG: GMC family oxidoreductase [Acidimicrobiales bacterium]
MASTQRADVVIVGAGPSGAVAAKRLAAEGLRVVTLEQGDWPDYSKARAGESDFEITANRYWNWDPNARAAEADYPVDDAESEITALMYNGVGGGTVIYAAHWERFLPSDFAVRTLDGVADDWPFSYEDLAPFYDTVEKDFAVSGLEGDTCYPEGHVPPLPPVPMNRIGRLGGEALNRLGWHWWPATNAIATVKHGALNPCAQRTSCLYACPTAAKASVDRTHWPALVKQGVELRTGARVSQVIVGSDGLADGVVYVDGDGVEHVQHADVTILCTNGIGTPRLLLMSETTGHSDGLANSSGLVGKRLMMHPFATSIGVFEDDLESWRGPWGQHLHIMEFYETDKSRDFVRGAKWALMPTGAPLAMMLPGLWGDADVWGENFHDTLRRRLGRSAMVGIICEDLPEESNQVTLSATATDSSGLPAPKVTYRNSENSKKMIRFQVERAEELLREMGAYEVISTPNIDVSGWHLLGTARMGTDPGTSVVDEWGRTHDVENLFIFDGSTFPTSSGVNPTATIAANALRFADHLARDRRSVTVPS